MQLAGHGNCREIGNVFKFGFTVCKKCFFYCPLLGEDRLELGENIPQKSKYSCFEQMTEIPLSKQRYLRI